MPPLRLIPSRMNRADIEARRREATRGDEHTAELTRCAADPAYFVDSYCVIDDAQGHGDGGGTMPFKLWPAQKDLLRGLRDDQLTIILKARQLGISWLACSFALWLCSMKSGQMVVLLSKDEDAAKELLRRIRVMYERLPDWLKAACPRNRKDPDSTTVFGWANGSKVKSFAATKGAGRSFTASLVIMDEAAWMTWAGQVYTAAKPTMEAGGRLIILSTANGASGLFYQLWQKAEQGLNKIRAVFLPWWSRPGRDQAWYDAQVAESTDPASIKQEYPSNSLEAFIASGRIRFPGEWVNPQAAHALPALDARLWPESLRGLEGMTVYKAPVFGRSYLIPADVAEGKVIENTAAGDLCAAPVIDAETFEEVACLHGRWEPGELARRLFLMGGEYNAAPVIVERNNHGHAVLLGLANLGYRNIARGHDNSPGWLTNATTKPIAVDGLAARLKDGSIAVRSPAALSEMRVYRVLDNGATGAPGGEHDDLVMAWAIACGWSLIGARSITIY